MNRISSCIVSQWRRARYRDNRTYSFVHLTADFFQRTLNTFDDLPDGGGIFLSMVALEYYARVSDYADWLTARKYEVSKNGSVRGEERKRLFKFWWCWDSYRRWC
jgi:hypothetical protein